MRFRSLMALALITPLGLATKAYGGPGGWWVQDYLGGVLYELFWILAVLAVRPGWRPWPIASGVLVATCALETLQLWHPPALKALRATFPGRTLLGTTFVWWDCPHYVFGAALGGCLASWLRGRSSPAHRGG
jgi:hypothetical protein